MPVFEFDCCNCGIMFEELVTSQKEKLNCPECGSNKIKKKFSVFGFSGGTRNSSSSGASCGTCSSRKCSSCH